MNIVADLHCHTIASDHAFSTVSENQQAAKEKNLIALGVTDHGYGMADAPHPWHFDALKMLPRQVNGVYLIRGAEANIVDYEGHLDLTDEELKKLDLVIASFHVPCCPPCKDPEQVSAAWMAVARNPHVDVIGHSGDQRYLFDYRPVIEEFGRQGKVVEINSHSFVVRPGSDVNCRKIARLCAEMEVPVLVNSDAHVCYNVGHVQEAVAMLEEIHFPERLVLNAHADRLMEYLKEKAPNPLI